MFVKIYPENPNPKHIKQVVDCLKKGGVIIYPTDTIYGIGCDINNQKAVEKVCQLKGIKPDKANFSFICHDLSHISDFTLPLENNVFKLMRRALPGPFTFILKANSNVPKIFKSNKKTVGIRIPDNTISIEIVKELGNPIMSASIPQEDELSGFFTDPELIYEKYKNKVDLIIDGGYGKNIPSTVVDCSEGEPKIIRQGIGILDDYE
jgi:tRNA threonylcarbamoyl adenosine modification protein (Sua5/YciO/YrdC/YwlC family)